MHTAHAHPPRRQAARAALITAAWLALAACGGGGGSSEPAPTEKSARLNTATEGALVAQARDLVRQRRTALATAQPRVWLDGGVSGATAIATTSTSTTTAGAAAEAATAAPYAGTLNQEAGVDEADGLKTDGRHLYLQHVDNSTSSPRHLVRAARTQPGAGITPLADWPLPAAAGTYPQPRGLMISADGRTLAALSQTTTFVGMPEPCPPGMACAATTMIWPGTAVKSEVHVDTASVATDGNLTPGLRLQFDGQLVASRRVGQVIYLVATHTPVLAADTLPLTASAEELDAALAQITSATLLPRLRINGGPEQALVAESDCYVQPTNSSRSLAITTVLAIDLSGGATARAARCFLGGTEALYMSTSHLYLATSRSPAAERLADGTVRFPDGYVTDVHKFSFDGLGIAYKASGEVAGHLGWDAQQMALRMSEQGADLRVLTFTGSLGWAAEQDASSGKPASPATLTVLRERAADATLQPVATLPNARQPAALGKPGEQIMGVRFAGERAYLVTFRRTDPLYVLDLANPLEPRLAGALEVPGYSDSLHVLPNGLLFGVGRDADAQGRALGVKLALFDVADAAQPRLLAEKIMGTSGSRTALDGSPHGLNLMQVGPVARLALPMGITDSPWSGSGSHQLYRLEVDTAQRTWRERPALLPPASGGLYEVTQDRAVQIGDDVYYASGGGFSASAW